MSLLQFGHAGRKILVFPTSRGRFFEYEDNKMIAAVADKLDSGEIQIYCVDSVDDESWYNKRAHPYWRLQRHLQYERYIVNDVFPLMWNRNWTPYTAVTGCSFGAYHAANFAFRHPDMVNACICMGGSFDIRQFRRRLVQRGCVLQQSARLPRQLHRRMAVQPHAHRAGHGRVGHVLGSAMKSSPPFCAAAVFATRLAVWGDQSYHDWPWWRPMARTVLVGVSYSLPVKDPQP